MPKNKRKIAPMRNMHSYFGKKGRANQGPIVDDGSEQVNLVGTASHVLEEQEGLEEEIPMDPPTPEAAQTPEAAPISQR